MTASAPNPDPPAPTHPLIRLAWLALPVFLLLFACGQLAVLTTPAAAPGQTGSALRADYSPWAFLAVQPVQAGLAEAAVQDRQGSGAVVPPPRAGIFQVTPPAGETAIGQLPVQSATPAVFLSATPTEPGGTPSPTGELSPSPTASQTPSMTAAVGQALPSQTATWLAPAPSASPTATLTPTSRPSPSAVPATPTRIVTRGPSATATIHNLPTYTGTPSATASLPPTATFTRTNTPLPTLTSSPTSTPTFTSSPSATPSPTDTLTPGPTYTPTFTATATDTPDPQLTPDLCSSSIPAGEPDLGPPDGEFAYLGCGTYYIIDLGTIPVDATDGGGDPDVTYYERINPNQPDTIALDWVTFELGVRDANLGCNISYWETVFEWGDGNPTNNGHLGASYPENDNQAVPLSALYGSGSLQTGIRIDVNALGLNGVYGCARITSPINWPDNDGAEIDAIEVIQP